MSKILIYLNSSPIVRTLIPFLSPLFIFFDDYWYYIYHNDLYTNLVTMQDFLVFMYVVNSERIVPDFLRFDNYIQPKSYGTSNFTQYTNKQIIVVD